MKINFSDVRLGERFTTPHSKRLMTCVKIETTLVDGQPSRPDGTLSGGFLFM